MRYCGYALLVMVTMAVSLLATRAAPTQTQALVQPAPEAQPHWSSAYAGAFPGCVDNDKASFLPARIVVVAHRGEAKVLPYNHATVARITATWATPDVRDDLFTIGRCAR
jgi:hypothetical protein